MDRELTVTNHVGIREALELVEASTGKETLGMCLAPDGNMNDEMKRLTKKSGHGQVTSAQDVFLQLRPSSVYPQQS